MYEAVLHRVDMNVIDISGKLLLIADAMFPEAALPYSSFAFLAF